MQASRWAQKPVETSVLAATAPPPPPPQSADPPVEDAVPFNPQPVNQSTSVETAIPIDPIPPNTENIAPMPYTTDFTEPFATSIPIDMDEFAQTRPPDDLFADDFEPMAEPVVIEEQVESVPAVPAVGDPPKQPSSQRGGRGGGRGGRGGRRGGNHGNQANTSIRTASQPETSPSDEKEDDGAAKATTDGAPAPPKAEAVRGDRSGTGGVKKAKLTDEKLNALMEEMKLKNASLEAAHARAEADETSFNVREAEELERRKRERQNRQQMMGEREKNRLRKLQAVQGREWDAEKPEQVREFGNERRNARGQYTRGAHGGIARDARNGSLAEDIANTDESRDFTHDSPDSLRGIGAHGRGGRGGRGRGGRGGRGRGGFESATPTGSSHSQSVPGELDFPALPTTDKPVTYDGKPPPEVKTNVSTRSQPSPNTAATTSKPAEKDSSAVQKPSWADEMDSPVVAR